MKIRPRLKFKKNNDLEFSTNTDSYKANVEFFLTLIWLCYQIEKMA